MRLGLPRAADGKYPDVADHGLSMIIPQAIFIGFCQQIEYCVLIILLGRCDRPARSRLMSQGAIGLLTTYLGMKLMKRQLTESADFAITI